MSNNYIITSSQFMLQISDPVNFKFFIANNIPIDTNPAIEKDFFDPYL